MILTNGFCIVLDKNILQKVRSRFIGIKRFGREKCEEEIEIAGRKAIMFSFRIFGNGLPAVHGVSSGEEIVEFALLSESSGKIHLERDIAGTRPIYTGKGIISTDHRFHSDTYKLALPRKFIKKEEKRGEEAVAHKLALIIEDAVRKRVSGMKRVSVAFSGGLDSSIIAFVAKKYTSVALVSVFVEGSADQDVAKKSAEKIDIPLLQAKVEREEIKETVRGIYLPYQPSTMDIALYSIYNIASKKASEIGCEAIMLGQMADELFGGYMKYLSLLVQGKEMTEETMRKDIEKLSTQGFPRDEIACAQWLIPLFPYSDRRIIELALSLPIEYKIRGRTRKYILRRAAEILGLPDEIVNIGKKAAQYSSGIQKFIA